MKLPPAWGGMKIGGDYMADYIKREDALEQFDYYDLGEYLTTQIRGMLMDIPSADVAPVRHGRWELDTAHTEEIYVHPVKCSVCGQTEVLEYETLTPYCPNCGAKMDG